MPPFSPHRVLVTGVSNPLGAEVARRLAPQVPFLFGCDKVDPVSALEEMDFVHADTRLSVIGKLVRQLKIDTVVHLAVMVDSPTEERSIHETDVIGTMNVLVGCAAPSSPVRRLVVKSSAVVYGASPSDPEALISPIEKFSGYRAFSSMGSRSPPIARIVTPDPAHVNTAHTTAVVIARPPGIHPSSA